MFVGVGWSVHDTHMCVILENCYCKDKTLTDKITKCFWRFLTYLTVINN